jgi:AcrR family transcriptional regulator
MKRQSDIAPSPPTANAANAARRRIIAGARRHFFANGFRRVTMDDLAEELGMSKKTLYTHFSSKEELVKAVLLNKFDEAAADFAQISISSSGGFPAALQQLLDVGQRHTEEVQPLFARDLRRAAPELFQFVEQRRRGIIQCNFGKLFAEGRKSGHIRNDLSAAVLIEILLGAVQAVINPPKLAELGLTPRTGFAAVIKVILHGVVVTKGKQNL